MAKSSIAKRGFERVIDQHLELLKKELLEEFKTSMCDESSTVDPDDEHDWYCLAVGWFLGKGASVDDAHELAQETKDAHDGHLFNYW